MKITFVFRYIAAVFLMAAASLFEKAFPNCAFQLALGVVAEGKKTIDEQILESLAGVSERLKEFDALKKGIEQNASDYSQVTQIVTEVKAQLDDFRKKQISIKAKASRPGEISDEVAMRLGAIALIAGIRQERFSGHALQVAESEIKNVLGIEAKSALTTTDIPLPTQFSGDIVELVYQYGLARKLGTVYPLGTASVKLPKLSTDPVFGLIAASGTVTEKSPQISFVTFSPEKFGGLIRLPSEIEEDSIVAMGQFIGRYSARQMASIEDWNFFCGTGAASGVNGTAKGLITMVNPSNENKVYVQGGATTSGKTKPSDMTLDDLRSLRAIPNGAVLQRAVYMFHPTYEQALSKFNTSATVQPYQRANPSAPATLDGYPIVWVPSLPVYSTTASVTTVHALFGDPSYNYLGIRRGFSFDTSREAAFATDEILIRALERFTIGKMATDCVAGLSTSTS